MNEPYLAAVCHDIKSNTLEATWLQKTETEFKRVKCRNYSAEQKDEFLADCGEEGQKYVDMAGWPDVVAEPVTTEPVVVEAAPETPSV